MSHRFSSRPLARAIALVSLLLLHAGSAIAADSITGTSIAALVSDGPRSGQWKYTIDFQWASANPVYQITFDLGLATCPCICMDAFEFEFPAGASPGNYGDCWSYFNGKFSCDGDYWVGLTTPSVDWWPMSSSCRPRGSGTGQLVMYSYLSPKTVAASNGDLYMRSGSTYVSGKISGQVPSCHGCANVSVEESTWGSIKAVYR
ncbi:MAG TPA: hypothetical protein VFR10_13225 [bacterium]|nr:hypothetical protein [bacterium]